MEAEKSYANQASEVGWMRRRLRGGDNGVSYEKLGIQNGGQPPDYACLIRESALSGCSWSLD